MAGSFIVRIVKYRRAPGLFNRVMYSFALVFLEVLTASLFAALVVALIEPYEFQINQQQMTRGHQILRHHATQTPQQQDPMTNVLSTTPTTAQADSAATIITNNNNFTGSTTSNSATDDGDAALMLKDFPLVLLMVILLTFIPLRAVYFIISSNKNDLAVIAIPRESRKHFQNAVNFLDDDFDEVLESNLIKHEKVVKQARELIKKKISSIYNPDCELAQESRMNDYDPLEAMYKKWAKKN